MSGAWVRHDELEALRLAAQLAGLPPSTDVVLPTDRHVVVHGMRLHYLDWGNQTAPPVLFLHGGGLHAHSFDLVCLELRDAFHCLALDQRGHGDSEWSPELDYGLDAHVADIDGFVGALGLERFVLVGMSMGGLNAIAYAARRPAGLAALAIVDVGPELRSAGTRRIGGFIRGAAARGSIDEFAKSLRSFNPSRHADLLRRSLRYALRETPEGTWTWKYDPRQFGGAGRPQGADRIARLWAAVEAIACPTIVFRGGRSDIFHDEDAEKLVRRLRDGRWMRIEGAGHNVHSDAPVELAAGIRAFVAERLPGPAGP